MKYDIKITDLANKRELVDQGPTEHRLYKFALNAAPDGLWVLLLQRAALEFSEVTLSANEAQKELWASADAALSVKRVLACAQKAVAIANADAEEAEARAGRAAREKAAAEAEAQAVFVAELEELDFSEPGDDPPVDQP